MDEYDHTLVSLVVVGAFIALGKMLVANEVITLRLFICRIILDYCSHPIARHALP